MGWVDGCCVLGLGGWLGRVVWLGDGSGWVVGSGVGWVLCGWFGVGWLGSSKFAILSFV